MYRYHIKKNNIYIYILYIYIYMYIPLVIFHYNMYTAYWAPMPIHCINDDGLKICSESPWPLPSSFVKIRVVLLKAFADPSINHESQGLLQAKKLTKPSTMSFKRIHGRHMRCQKGHMEDKRSDMMWYDVIYTWMGNTWSDLSATWEATIQSSMWATEETTSQDQLTFTILGNCAD